MKLERKIDLGYFCVARKIFNSKIIDWPPLYFKLWVYLIGKANHKTVEIKGQVFNRGECLVTYEELQKIGSYNIGWRKETPTKSAIGNFLEKARENNMITTRKTTVGLFISIVNYDYYQLVSNYESNEEDNVNPITKQCNPPIINNNENNDKNEKNILNNFDNLIIFFEDKLKRKCAIGEHDVLVKLASDYGEEDVKRKIDYASNKGITYISANYISTMFKNISPIKKISRKDPFISCGKCNESGYIFTSPNLMTECECHKKYTGSSN